MKKIIISKSDWLIYIHFSFLNLYECLSCFFFLMSSVTSVVKIYMTLLRYPFDDMKIYVWSRSNRQHWNYNFRDCSLNRVEMYFGVLSFLHFHAEGLGNFRNPGYKHKSRLCSSKKQTFRDPVSKVWMKETPKQMKTEFL